MTKLELDNELGKKINVSVDYTRPKLIVKLQVIMDSVSESNYLYVAVHCILSSCSGNVSSYFNFLKSFTKFKVFS